MTAAAQPWSYALSVKEAVRLPLLSEDLTFAELTSKIVSGLRVLCCHRSEIAGTDFRRPVYTLDIGRPLFDSFFNSPFGYRAAYFRSPGAGLDANVQFLAAVAERLVSDPQSATAALSSEFIRESLRTPSAKAWLAEHGKEVDRKCPNCKGEWSIGACGSPELAEIRNGRWESTPGQNAEWGRKAPYLTKLRVMGAFLNDRYHELVPHDKRLRAYDIHQFGWS
ncbi:hypothetical protein [Hydrogenophaga sp. OTU3427]|uniref:hypothetical protein n=1 Tax=Hydrogenophaga sp. OTU3427 TaxID=3043856 RepID=UPI00313A929C